MGEHLSIALHYLKVRAGGDFLTCLGFGSMGSGVCTAIGYQMGSARRRVYAICGDGCFLMYGADGMAIHHQVPVTFVVINDSKSAGELGCAISTAPPRHDDAGGRFACCARGRGSRMTRGA